MNKLFIVQYKNKDVFFRSLYLKLIRTDYKIIFVGGAFIILKTGIDYIFYTYLPITNENYLSLAGGCYLSIMNKTTYSKDAIINAFHSFTTTNKGWVNESHHLVRWKFVENE